MTATQPTTQQRHDAGQQAQREAQRRFEAMVAAVAEAIVQQRPTSWYNPWTQQPLAFPRPYA
jgi:hypothetical protein